MKPPTIWEEGGITHPCKHEASFEDSCLRRDRFACPVCGLRWRVEQSPPIKHASGWVEPGKRRVLIDAQMQLPLTPGRP